jgi:hypothetical protein
MRYVADLAHIATMPVGFTYDAPFRVSQFTGKERDTESGLDNFGRAGPPFPRRCFNLRLPHPCALCKGGSEHRRRGLGMPERKCWLAGRGGLAHLFPGGVLI